MIFHARLRWNNVAKAKILKNISSSLSFYFMILLFSRRIENGVGTFISVAFSRISFVYFSSPVWCSELFERLHRLVRSIVCGGFSFSLQESHLDTLHYVKPFLTSDLNELKETRDTTTTIRSNTRSDCTREKNYFLKSLMKWASITFRFHSAIVS